MPLGHVLLSTLVAVLGGREYVPPTWTALTSPRDVTSLRCFVSGDISELGGIVQ